MRTLASLTSIGRLTPAITSTPGRFINEMARLLGVPPNMSVSSTTPSPVSTSVILAWISARRDSMFVIRADTDGRQVALRADHMLERETQLFGKAAMGDEDEDRS